MPSEEWPHNACLSTVSSLTATLSLMAGLGCEEDDCNPTVALFQSEESMVLLLSPNGKLQHPHLPTASSKLDAAPSFIVRLGNEKDKDNSTVTLFGT